MNSRLEVYPYSIEKLREIIAESSKNSLEVILKKLHHQYFNGYCDHIGVKTIVVENGYVDQHFLEDYAAYYVRCYKEYDRFCTRLHFFKAEFSDQEVCDYLGGGDGKFEELLKESYLGFSVIKPLPRTVVGRTCLATYPDDTDAVRHFPSVRQYEANLFGITLQVRSLAFQEQDRVAAACATSALWSVFQGTGKEFQHVIPSPVQITRAATEKQPIESRVLPSRGLSTAMMAHAIRHVGLEPDLVKVNDQYILKSTLYAYLRGRIPMILGIELWDVSKDPCVPWGYHAVAVTGFRLLSNDVETPAGEKGFKLTASRIHKIYVHDDQVGPFARMVIDDEPVTVDIDEDGNPITCNSISTSWVGGDGKIGSVRAIPTIQLVPLYHKIRIPFKNIHDIVLSFDLFLEKSKPIIPIPAESRLEWDIYLTTNNDVKTDIRKTGILKGDYLKDFLLDGMPRFIWRATAYLDGSEALDLLFDATDIEQGEFFIRALEYDEDLSLFLRVISKTDAIERIFNQELGWQVIDWFKKHSVEGLD